MCSTGIRSYNYKILIRRDGRASIEALISRYDGFYNSRVLHSTSSASGQFYSPTFKQWSYGALCIRQGFSFLLRFPKQPISVMPCGMSSIIFFSSCIVSSGARHSEPVLGIQDCWP